MFEFNEEYYFNNKMFKDEYLIGDKVYYLDENNNYKVGKIRRIEEDKSKETNLYLVTGCKYLRSKEHIYGLCV